MKSDAGGTPRRVVVKIGTSSITSDEGALVPEAIDALCGQVVDLMDDGVDVVVVTSAAISAGLPALGMTADRRPTDTGTLQALSAVGQIRLMGLYDAAFERRRRVAGQVLLVPHDFSVRRQYLHARSMLGRMLELGVVPVINENDAIAVEEIRFGDNDRIAALVAQLVDADLLVLLTDTDGVLTADPRFDADATLIEEIVRIDRELEALAGGSGSNRGSGGMYSKIAAAKMASWAGVRTIIAASSRPDVLRDAVAGSPGVGTTVRAQPNTISARKLWIGFAVGSTGVVEVDDGARRALAHHGRSLLAAGVTSVKGAFESGDAVEVAASDGTVFAKGLAAMNASEIDVIKGKRTADLADEQRSLVIHRDDLVILPD